MQSRQQTGHNTGLVVFMNRQRWRARAISAEERAGVSRVFATYDGDTPEHREGAQGNVTQVAYGGAHHMQRPGGGRQRPERRGPVGEIGGIPLRFGRPGRVACVGQACSLNFASSAGRGTAPTT